MQKIFLFIVKWFFFNPKKELFFELRTEEVIISIWSNFLENINSIEQLLSKIQRVERKCELGFDAILPVFTGAPMSRSQGR